MRLRPQARAGDPNVAHASGPSDYAALHFIAAVRSTSLRTDGLCTATWSRPIEEWPACHYSGAAKLLLAISLDGFKMSGPMANLVKRCSMLPPHLGIQPPPNHLT